MNSAEGNNPARNYIREFREKFLIREKLLTKRALAGREQKARLTPVKKEINFDSIFKTKPHVPMSVFIGRIEKEPGNIPGYGKKYTKEEKKQLAKSASKGLGSYLEQNPDEPKKIIDRLKKEISSPQTSWGNRDRAKRELSFWKDRFSKN